MKFVSGPQGQVIVAEETAYVPANTVVVDDPDYLADYYAERPLMRAALQTLPYASAWYSFPGENSVKIGDVIYDRVQSVLTLETEPGEGLELLVSEVQDLLPQR